MSESEQRGRCRQQLEAWFANNISSVPRYSWMIADAIDRLAADVAAVMEMTQEIALRVPSEFGQDACDVAVRVALKERDAAIRERDEARAEVERLKAELAARPAANYPEISDSSPAASQPAAPAAGWLTQKELRVLADHAQALREQRFALERGGLSSGYSMNPGDLKHQADAINAILARAGSPPVVEVPKLGFLCPMTGREQGIVLAYRDALDAAGVKWKEGGA